MITKTSPFFKTTVREFGYALTLSSSTPNYLLSAGPNVRLARFIEGSCFIDNSNANSYLSTESSDPHSVIDREPTLNWGGTLSELSQGST
jgi:hypothetical protein